MKRSTVLSVVMVLILLLSACAMAPTAPQTGTGGAEQVQTLGFSIPKNSKGNTVEQQNIIDRIKVTTDPSKVMWIHLISLDGKIVLRTPVAQKVTSSGKRLEPITAANSNEYGGYPNVVSSGSVYETSELIQPDGTFGSSDPYIFWFDPQHRYFQWGTAGGLGYLLTDFPIDLTNPQDIITGLYNTDITAYNWQKTQEALMCEKEGKTYNQETGVCQ
jgi:hypothetical protein